MRLRNIGVCRNSGERGVLKENPFVQILTSFASLLAVLALAGCASVNLRTAAQQDDTSRVRTLLNQGVDPNAHDEYGVTALRIVASSDVPWSRSNLDIARLLIAHGAKVNQADAAGVTPLEAAACGGHADMVRLLLAHGADPDAKDNDGETARACAAEHNHPDVVALLGGRGNSVGQERGGMVSSREGAGQPGALKNGRRPILVLVLNNNCQPQPIHNCQWDNGTTRGFFANALVRALTDRGFLVDRAGESSDLQLSVTITGIGDDESVFSALLVTLPSHQIASARYRVTSSDGSVRFAGSARSTDPGSTRASLRKLAENIAAAVSRR